MTSPSDREYIYTDRDFERVSAMIRTRAGISLARGKEDMVYSRIARRLRVLGMSSFAEYLDQLEREGGDEWEHFTNALTTNLTAFFRESHHFQMLDQHLASLHNKQNILIWCAAASTGEEPYSLAITACEHFGTLRPPVSILATDIDTNCLETCSKGIYPMERVEKLSQERLKRFFRRGAGAQAGYCKVIDELRQLITFRQLNLLDPSYGLRGPFDAVFCRNVMIYFDKPTQYSILKRITPLLSRDGLFFAGHSESFFHATDLIKPVGRTVYQLSDAAARAATPPPQRQSGMPCQVQQ